MEGVCQRSGLDTGGLAGLVALRAVCAERNARLRLLDARWNGPDILASDHARLAELLDQALQRPARPGMLLQLYFFCSRVYGVGSWSLTPNF